MAKTGDNVANVFHDLLVNRVPIMIAFLITAIEFRAKEVDDRALRATPSLRYRIRGNQQSLPSSRQLSQRYRPEVALDGDKWLRASHLQGIAKQRSTAAWISLPL